MTHLKTNIDIGLIWKKINQSISVEEEQLLSKWLDESSENQKYMDQATQFFLQGSGFPEGTEATEKAWKDVESKIRKKYWFSPGWAASLSAAAVLLFLIIHTVITPTTTETKNRAPEMATLVSPGSNQAVLILDDGSVHDLAATKNLVLKEGNSSKPCRFRSE